MNSEGSRNSRLILLINLMSAPELVHIEDCVYLFVVCYTNHNKIALLSEYDEKGTSKK